MFLHRRTRRELTARARVGHSAPADLPSLAPLIPIFFFLQSYYALYHPRHPPFLPLPAHATLSLSLSLVLRPVRSSVSALCLPIDLSPTDITTLLGAKPSADATSLHAPATGSCSSSRLHVSSDMRSDDNDDHEGRPPYLHVWSYHRRCFRLPAAAAPC